MVAEHRAKPRKRSKQAYVTVWATLGTIAFAYMTASTVMPELVGEVIPIAQRESDDQTRRMAAEVEAMRQEVAKLRRELATSRTELAAAPKLDAPLPAPQPPMLPPVGPQLALPPIPTPTDQAAAPSGLSPRIIAKAAERNQKAPPSAAARDIAAAGAKLSEPADAPKTQAAAQSGQGTWTSQPPVLLNGAPTTDETQNPIITGSVTTDDARAARAAPPVDPRQAPAKAPAAPVVKGPVGIEIGGADSIEALRLSWTVMNDQNGPVLGRLSPRYRLNTTGSGEPLALVAGPIATPEEATRICATLKAKGVRCKVGGYSGERL